MITSRKIIMCAPAAVAFAAGLSLNGTSRIVESGIFSEAQARVGRPLTPISYAGVARRTTRRAVAVGAAGVAAEARRCASPADPSAILCAWLKSPARC